LEESIHLPHLNRSNTRLKFLDGSDGPLDKLDSHLLRSRPRQLGGLEDSMATGLRGS
jgi:hypothetical protein